MATQLSNADVQHMLQGISIPPRPSLLVEVNEALKQEYPKLNHIADLVAKDVGIAAAMLRTVNSPLFGLRSKVNNPLQAVHMLGATNVRNIVTGLVLRSTLESKAVSLERFWDTSEKAAQIAVFLCSRLPGSPKDEAYIFSLFHDCGIPLLMQRFPTYRDTLRIASTSKRPMPDIEDERHETNHAVLGFMVAKSWGMSPEICEAILRHHDPSVFDQADRDLPLVPNLVAVNLVAVHLNNTSVRLRDDEDPDSAVAAALAYLGLSMPEYRDLRDDVMSRCCFSAA